MTWKSGLWVATLTVAVGCDISDEGKAFDNTEFDYAKCGDTYEPQCVNEGCISDDVTEDLVPKIVGWIDEEGLLDRVRLSRATVANGELFYTLQWQVGWLRGASSGRFELGQDERDTRQHFQHEIALIGESLPSEIPSLSEVRAEIRSCSGLPYSPCEAIATPATITIYGEVGNACEGGVSYRVEFDLHTASATCHDDGPVACG